MLKVVVVVGVPGVGKSSVLAVATKKLSERGYRVRLVNFGDYMLEYLRKSGVVKSRDQIRSLRLATQLEAQKVAARDIRNEFEALPGDRVIGIVDTHAVIKTQLGYWPGLPLAVLQELKPSVIVVIEASPDEILSRQLRDSGRYRADLSSRETIEELLQINRYYAITSSVISGAALRFIQNSEGCVEIAAEELIKVIEEI
ncbi:MAG: adenylate kinase [Sulfolobales archaeon]